VSDASPITINSAADVYGPDFFAHVNATAERSASRVLPLVMEALAPRSVVDVGCGTGAWLAEAARLGVDDYLGVDGYTPGESLRIPVTRFLLQDLTEPVRLDRRFDLVLCLEVAEHLPPTAADTLVGSLARLGSAVLFSAAVPHQGGSNHLNEQWLEYWAERFRAHGLLPVDAIRPSVWDDGEVAWWYRQNALLFCGQKLIAQTPALREARCATRDHQLSVVHPDLYSWMVRQRDRLAHETVGARSLGELLGMLPRAVADTWVRRRYRQSSRGVASKVSSER
jgi:SAM-dependent methyltransferase